jgi:hypothetical protein
MPGLGRIARIRETPGQGIDQAEAFVNLSQQQATGVRGQVSPGKIGVDVLTTETGKHQGQSVTLCHCEVLSS